MSPTYFLGEWIHGFEDEPYLFYNELDDERYSIRHIEIYKDGRMVRAGVADLEQDSMALPDQPIPTVEAINAHEEFRHGRSRRENSRRRGAWRIAGRVPDNLYPVLKSPVHRAQ